MVDLAVTDLTVSPVSPSIGKNATITAVVKNQGPARSDTCVVAFYVDGISLGISSLVGLQPGETGIVDATFTATGGNHAVSLLGDRTDSVVESDETNS